MPVIIRHSGPVPQLRSRIDLLTRLVHDMTEIALGDHPGRDVLDAAPMLVGWRQAVRPEPCLMGFPEGHPNIAEGRPALTSGLWVLAPELGYARTLNRFYALGFPAGD